MNQKKFLVLSIMAMLLTSTFFSMILSYYDIDIDTSPPALGQYGGSSSLPSSRTIAGVTPQQAYYMLSDWGPRMVAGVLEDVENSKVIDIIVLFSDIEYVWDMLQQMSPEKAGSLLLDMETKGLRPLTVELFSFVAPRHSEILDYMINADISTSALLIEDTIKSLVDGLNETDKYQAVRNLAWALNLVSNDNLVQLFLEIAGFPETPSSVAYLVESMDVDVILYIFNKWLDLEEYDTIVNVMNYVTTSTLSVIYRGMGGDYRLFMYPFLTESILSRLPDIGFFQVTQFSVSPLKVKPGDPVTIIFNLVNVGQQTDDYTIPVTINGEIELTYTGILEVGSSETFELNITRDQEGTYGVAVDSESSSFRVEAPPPSMIPAQLEIENIQIIPAEVVQGMEMTVFVIVTNLGDEPGFEMFELKIDGSISDFVSAQVFPVETKTLVFNFIADFSIGQHTVQVGDLLEDFIVLTPPVDRPLVTIIITVLVTVGGLAYYLYENDYLKKIIPSFSKYFPSLDK